MTSRYTAKGGNRSGEKAGKAEPARFLGGKITAGNFLPKTRRA